MLFLHLSKSGGTMLCELAKVNGCSRPAAGHNTFTSNCVDRRLHHRAAHLGPAPPFESIICYPGIGSTAPGGFPPLQLESCPRPASVDSHSQRSSFPRKDTLASSTGAARAAAPTTGRVGPRGRGGWCRGLRRLRARRPR